MKLNTFATYLVPALGIPASDVTEGLRALRENSAHFDPESEINEEVRKNQLIRFAPDLLRAKPGPGGGIDADPFRAGFLLVSLMVPGPRRDAATNTWMAWHLTQEGSVLSGWGEDWRPTLRLCPLTKQVVFGDAMKAVCGDEDLAKRVQEIRVLSNDTAEIVFDGDRVSRFTDATGGRELGLIKSASLRGDVLVMVARLLKQPN